MGYQPGARAIIRADETIKVEAFKFLKALNVGGLRFVKNTNLITPYPSFECVLTTKCGA